MVKIGAYVKGGFFFFRLLVLPKFWQMKKRLLPKYQEMACC